MQKYIKFIKNIQFNHKVNIIYMANYLIVIILSYK